jgi:hypothetical protein
MTVRKAWRNLKYQIADKLFAYELDEAYDMGIRIGAEFATHIISFRVNLNSEKIKLTKVEKQGYEKAIQVIQDCKPQIEERCKAYLP